MTTNNTKLITVNALHKKADALLLLEKISPEDIKGLAPAEIRQLEKTASKIFNRLKGLERDKFLNKIELIVPAEFKNSVWENNQTIIRTAIGNHMRNYGAMPAKSHVAEQTGLSRQTVAKHFKEYSLHPEFKAEMEQFKLMSHTVLAHIFKYACSGDTKAARLYFEMVGTLNKQPTGTVVNEQNNYIQINNTILSQENLKQLTAEQLNQIEQIVMNKA